MTTDARSLDADGLDDAWDAAIDASRSHPELSPILRALHATDPATPPDAHWMHTLENRLMHPIATPQPNVWSPPLHHGGPPHSAPARATTTARPVRRLAPLLATAALVLLTLLVGLAGLRDGRRAPGGESVPAVAQSTVIAGLAAVTCDIAPRDGELLAGDPTSASIFPLPIDGAPQAPVAPLPELGEPLDQAAIDGIATTLAELHACQSTGDADREQALYSSDLLRRTGGQPLTWRIPAPTDYRIDNILSFADGRAMATLVEPAMASVFVVLAREGERWLIDEVAISDPSPIPAATAPALPSCDAPALPADLAPPAAGAERPASLIPFDADQQIVAGPFSTDDVNQPPFTGADADPPTVAAVNAMLTSVQDCAAVDGAAQVAPDVRNPVAPPRVLAFFSPDLLARGRIDLLPDPWWVAYPVQFGWEEWSLPAAEVRQLADDRVLVLLDATTSSDRAALVLVLRDGAWLIDEIAYVSDDPATLNPASDCTLPAPAEARRAPDWTQPLAYESALPEPTDRKPWFEESPLADEQQGRSPAIIAPGAPLPTGILVDAETRAGIAAALTDLIACRGVADDPQRMGRATMAYARSFERMSDDLFRRYQPAQPIAVRWWDSFSGLSAISPNALDPAWLDALQELPDGRVLALVTSNRVGEQGQAMVFVLDNGRWLLDEIALIGDGSISPTPTVSPTSSAGAPATSVAINLAELIFTPNQVTIPAGQEVTVTLINQGVVRHSFVIAELGVNQVVAPGESVNLRITAPAGSYRFICGISGHEAAGMVGVLTVDDAPATPTV